MYCIDGSSITYCFRTVSKIRNGPLALALFPDQRLPDTEKEV